MAALMRCARFCVPAVQIPKLLRVLSYGSSQTSTRFPHKDTAAIQQRSWRSTVAAGVETIDSETAASPAQSQVDILLSSVERYTRQYGRISRKQLTPIVTSLDKEGTISLSSSLNLLRLYGSYLFDETPASRLELAEELWAKYKQYGVALEVGHYNTLLAVYNQNKKEYSPTQFLAEMETGSVSPNRVTYQRLIARFCDLGDIQGATQVLEHMKAASLPINDYVFHSFITGHLRAGDLDSARNILEVMRQSELEPTNLTYMTMAVGFAEKGDIAEVKKYISQAESENVPLRPGHLLEVYSALAVSGNIQHCSEIMPYLHNGMPFNQDAIRVCNQLIAFGCDDAAYKLFLEMPKPTRMDTDQTTLGRFFLRALARHERPVDKVMEFVKDMQEKGVNKDDLRAMAQLAYLESKPAYALSLLKEMKSEGFPVRAHFFWPAFCQFRDNKDKEGIYQTLEQLVTQSDTRDDFILSLHNYIIPALLAISESEADIVTRIQKAGFPEKEVNFAFFLYLIHANQLPQALEFLGSHEMTVAMTPVRACLQPYMHKNVDWTIMLPLLVGLKAQGMTWRGPALETTSMVLKQILVEQRKVNWADADAIFSQMQENGLHIFRRSQMELAEFFTGAPDEVLNRLNDLVSTERGSGSERVKPEPIPSDISLSELLKLVEQNPNNKSYHKRTLIKACAVGDVEEAEKLRSSLEAEGFVFPPQVLAQLAYLYAMFVKDADKAQDYLQQLESKFPEHRNYQAVVLKMAALLASQGKTDAAVERLQSFADKHKSVVEQQSIPKEDYFKDIIAGAADPDAAKRLMETLFVCGYVPRNSSFVLDSYMEKLVDSGDQDRILEEFEAIVKEHRRSPKVDKVLQFFINREDPERLQKEKFFLDLTYLRSKGLRGGRVPSDKLLQVVDLLTELHGLMNVFHHLIADFIECGHVKKARKIMDTPGLRANMQRLNYYCQSFIERNMIKELETLVEVTKTMFGVDRDNMLFHLIRGYVNQKEFSKAQDVLVQYEEEMLPPSARTLRFLARSLQAAGLPVNFVVPDFQPMVREDNRRGEKGETRESKAAAEPVSADAARQRNAAVEELKEAVVKGHVDKVLAALQGSQEGLMASAINKMKKPWPTEAMVSLMERLGKQGELEALDSVPETRVPGPLRDVLKSSRLIAGANCGRAEEVVERLRTGKSNSARHLSMASLAVLHAKAPQLMDKVESIGKQLFTDSNYTEPLSLLWCYYKLHNLPRADELVKEIPSLQKNLIVSSLCQAAVEQNKVELLESTLKMKKDLEDKRGMAIAYSHLLQFHVKQGDVEALERTCQGIVSEEIVRTSLWEAYVVKAENLLKENQKAVPVWAVDSSSSSDSDSSSSSDDEKKQR